MICLASVITILAISPGLARKCNSTDSSDHGKAVDIYRREELFGKTVKFVHKGIIYIPARCKSNCPTKDANGASLQPNQPYLLHLWEPSNDLVDAFKSKVRIDPLHLVARNDRCEVVEDEPDAIPRDEAISRALTTLGGNHRGHRYNLFGNNCGNFVSWSKYGDSERDEQIWERLNHYSNKLPTLKVNPLIPPLRSLVEGYYKI